MYTQCEHAGRIPNFIIHPRILIKASVCFNAFSHLQPAIISAGKNTNDKKLKATINIIDAIPNETEKEKEGMLL